MTHWPRPSSADLGWISAQLKKAVVERRAGLEAGHGSQAIPAELLFATASGLDPHISPEAALYQLDRVGHPKRYQDVFELRSAGISVYSTLNVQHIESRVDVVRQITGTSP